MKREKLGFVVYSSDRKALYKDKDYLELHCHTMEELEEWRSGLVRAGVQGDVHEEALDNVDEEDLDFLVRMIDSLTILFLYSCYVCCVERPRLREGREHDTVSGRLLYVYCVKDRQRYRT